MGDGKFPVVYRVWTFGPLVKNRVKIGEILALWGKFPNLIEVVPTNGGEDFAIYATTPEAEQALERWMLQNAPLAHSTMMRPEAITN